VIYARISKDATGQEAGVQRQVEACTHLAQAREWQLVGAPLIDNDISAFNGARRPGWEAVLGMIARHEVDVVIAWHMDRMCRRVADLVDLLKLAVGDGKRPGVGIATVHGDLDLSSPVGRMFATILIAVAEYEAAHKGERQQAAEAKKAEAGFRRTAGPRPFGWQVRYAEDPKAEAGRRREFVMDEAEAAAIREAADALLGGTSVSAVARKWAADGLRPPQAPFGPLPEQPWGRNSVTTVLRNPRLAGLAVYKGREIDGVTGRWEPILAEEKWRAIDALLAASDRTVTYTVQGETVTRKIKANTPRGVRSLLGGLGECPCGNRVEHGTNHLKQGVYRCRPATRGDRPGPHVAVRAEIVDEWVKANVIGELSRRDLEELVSPAPDVDTTGLRAEAAVIRERLDQMAADAAVNGYSASMLAAAARSGNARLAGIADKLAQTVGTGALAPVAARLARAARQGEDREAAALEAWDELDLMRRRELIRALAGSVILHPAGRGARFYDVQAKVDMPGLREPLDVVTTAM
jgi:DNA invertase Pin-like site-specific DNA recombinase